MRPILDLCDIAETPLAVAVTSAPRSMEHLASLSAQGGNPVAELIHQAVDDLLARYCVHVGKP